MFIYRHKRHSPYELVNYYVIIPVIQTRQGKRVDVSWSTSASETFWFNSFHFLAKALGLKMFSNSVSIRTFTAF